MACQADLTSHVAVLGAGPAGLTAGYLLARPACRRIVLEAEDQVGGIAKTVGPRRLPLRPRRAPLLHEVGRGRALWHEMLGEEFLVRPRLSRIYWNGRFLDYPLRARTS